MQALGNQEMPALVIDMESLIQDESVMDPGLGDLASLVQDHFNLAKQGRLTKELEWLQDLRAWKGEYDPAVLARIPENQSKIFVKLTRAWCGAARSLILNIMGMEGGYPWTIDPTPIPDLEHLDLDVLQEAVQQAASMLPSDQAQGFLQNHDFEAMLQAEKQAAQIACDKMQSEMEDQLGEQDWEARFTRTLLPYVIYGTQVMQGPMSVPKRPKRWARDVSGKWKLALQRWQDTGESFDLRPEFKPLDIFSVYPDPVANRPEELEYVCVRHVMNRHEMRGLSKLPAFDPDALEEVLLRHVETGDWVPERWESPVEAATDHTPTPKKHDRFVVIEWWGFLSGQMLRKYGIEVSDSLLTAECLANIWVCCGEVLKVSVSNMEPPRLPFFFVPYEDVPGSIWGQGVPRQMDDSQALYNACERAKVNNMGLACLTADTVVYRHQRPGAKKPRKYNQKGLVKVTIGELWDQKHKPNSGLRRNILRSLDESTGEFFGNRVKDIFCNGERDIFRVTTKRGYTIKSTDNHRFMTEIMEWQELKHFQVGDLIAVNGTNVPPFLICVDCGDPIIHRGARRCKRCAAKVNTWNVRQKIGAVSNRQASGTTARGRKSVRDEMKEACESCGKAERLHIHHVDRDPWNCDPKNLKTLCEPCHVAEHARHDNFGDSVLHTYVDYDEIVSIEPIGTDVVYDLWMEGPNHNFVANGFVSHNSGPQITIDASRISDREDAKQIRPFHVRFVNDMEGLTQSPVQIENIPCNIEYFRAVQADARQHLQKETSLPDFLATGIPGNLAHNRTAEGLSMSQNAALAFIRTVIGNIDTYLTQPMIEALYHWNMVFNPRQAIKGDYDVVAKGVSGAMTREIASQRLNQLLVAAGNPEIRPWVKVDNAVQLWAKVMGYEGMDLTYTPKEVMANRQQELAMQAEAESAPNRVQPVMPRENAAMQLLLHTPPTTPMYGPIYEEAAQIWGLMKPRLSSALDAWNQGQANQASPLVNPQDAATLSADLTPEEIHAPPSPAGRPLFAQGEGPAQSIPPGAAPGMGAAGGLHLGLQA